MSKLTVRLPRTLPAAQVIGLHAAYGDALTEGAVVLSLRLGEHDYVVTASREGRLLPLTRSGDEVDAGDALFALHLSSDPKARAEEEEAKLRLPIGRYRPPEPDGTAASASSRSETAVGLRRMPHAAATPDDLRERVARGDDGGDVASAGPRKHRAIRSGGVLRIALPLAGLLLVALGGVVALGIWGRDLLPFVPVRLDGPPPSARVHVPPARPGAMLSSAVSGMSGKRDLGPPVARSAGPMRAFEPGSWSGTSLRAPAAPARPTDRGPVALAARPVLSNLTFSPPGPVENALRISRRGQPPLPAPERKDGKTFAPVPTYLHSLRPPAVSGPPDARRGPALPRASAAPRRPSAPAASGPARLTAGMPRVAERPMQPRGGNLIQSRTAPRVEGFDVPTLGGGLAASIHWKAPRPISPDANPQSRPLSAPPRRWESLNANTPEELPSTMSSAATGTAPPRETPEAVRLPRGKEQSTGRAVAGGSGAGAASPLSVREAADAAEPQRPTPAAAAAALPGATLEEADHSPVGQERVDGAPGVAPNVEIALAPQTLTHSAILAATAPFSTCGPLAFAGPDPVPLDAPIRASGAVASADEVEAIRQALSEVAGGRSVALDLTVTGDVICRIERILPSGHSRFGGIDFRFGYGRKPGAPRQAAYVAGENPVVDVIVDRSRADGFLYVFYIDGHTGKIVHLLPHANRPENRVEDAGVETADHYRVRILYPAADVGPGRRGFLVGPPFGTNLLLAVVTPRPLGDAVQPGEDSADRVVTQVAEALRQPAASGHAIARRFFTTAPE